MFANLNRIKLILVKHCIFILEHMRIIINSIKEVLKGFVEYYSGLEPTILKQ